MQTPPRNWPFPSATVIVDRACFERGCACHDAGEAGVVMEETDTLAMITHVAIQHEDTIAALRAPSRHHDVIAMVESDEMAAQGTQGFLNENGRFLDRRTAYAVAVLNGQLKRAPGGYDGPELFSEDLW